MNDLRRLLLSLAFVSLLPCAAGAQTATLVRDINGEIQTNGSFGSVFDVSTVPGKVFFSATSIDPDNREMWASDGTAEGTSLLKDVCPGSCGSESQPLGTLNGLLFWAATTDDGTLALWRSDGTRRGTIRLLDAPIRINGRRSFDPQQISSVAGGYLYFVAVQGELDALWRTDGTPAGTRLVRTLDAGQRIETLLTTAGKVFLIVEDEGWSVWTSDGTAAGTREVRSLGNFRPIGPRAAGGHLFFVAGSFDGDELWASDGTAGDTRPVTDFATPAPFGPVFSSTRFNATLSNGRLFFTADDVVHGDEIYVSDGTAAGTRRITEFGTAEPGFGPIADLGGSVVFTANDDLGHNGVWVTNGDPASTRFQELPCGADCWDDIRGFVKVGPRVVVFRQAAYGLKVLSTDGTPAGTRLLRDNCPQDCDLTLPEDLPDEAGRILFSVGFNGTIWSTDGTPAGTRKEAVIPDAGFHSQGFRTADAGSFTLLFGDYHGSPTGIWALDPTRKTEPRLVTASASNGRGMFADNLTAFQNSLAFTACNGDDYSLWRSAGTEASTVPALVLVPPSPNITGCIGTVKTGNMASLGSALVYLLDKNFTHEVLWRTDGTAAGTQQLTPDDLEIQENFAAGTGRVYFRAQRNQTVSVWVSNGTLAGTMQLASWPVSGGKSPSQLTAVGSELYFFVGGSDKELWKSDGTPQGTKKVASGESSGTLPAAFTRVGSAVYFVWHGNAFDDAVWRTDGTAAGTRALGTVAGMDPNPYPGELTAFQGSLYFFAWKSHEARGLWRSDGTAAGTVLLAQFPETGNSAYPSLHQVTVVGNRLFFAADDRTEGNGHGFELWATDGTAAGTRLVRDIRPGIGSSRPAHLTAAGGRLFFSAAEETYGRELWVSDGTEAGTHLVQDISPFGDSSEPDRLAVAGDRLYFTADDGVSGRELWTLPLTGPAGCQPSSTRLCLSGGRYQVEASWRTGDPFSPVEGHGTGVSLSADTGYFWFFSPTNVEAVVKVLDGQGLNGHVWVFYGALSDVDYTITVTDTQTGVTRRYHNPPGQLASVGDTESFGPLGAYDTKTRTLEATPSPRPIITERLGKAAAAPCQTGGPTLCLNGNRFAVTVAWKDFQGNTGQGTATALTSDTGTFWFFNAANIELVVKVLDGRPVNNKFWLFYGALSNVEYTVTVTDTQTGTARTYHNPSGRFASVADTNAF